MFTKEYWKILRNSNIELVEIGSSHCGSMVMNPTSTHEDSGSIPGLAQWVKDPVLPQALV